ncbi:hypothetical protein [Hymenobacter nivis]|uniref:Uncharacterized protein n=1 Tax=Hymenobacter nivis TaxID=1850093 RepID=A0A502GW94_9BACT|nr:hypothetical protein [Hymenobacter nivis]TPG66539.1 hypothetical protein EAH73_09045 [Hymenobacter nivis]
MPTHSPTDLAARPAQLSLVLVQPTGMSVTMALLLGPILLLSNALRLIADPAPGRNIAGALIGLGLLLGAGYRLARGNRPRLLRLDREALHLEPLGPTPGQHAETIALSSITAYTYWLRLLRWRGFAQFHLRLELADGRVLHLADRPGPRPTDMVQLDALAKRLARRRKSGTRRRLQFFQTGAARGLLWASGGALAAGLGLLALGYEMGLPLLLLAVGYGATYYLWQDALPD